MFDSKHEILVEKCINSRQFFFYAIESMEKHLKVLDFIYFLGGKNVPF